tara:strand:+ start:94315 stop:95052 length:738 start_codon:yes stop_codon:yes gene_type:complete
MQNKRYGTDRDNRRSSYQRTDSKNYAAEDNKRRFQDQDYDRYFPEQNSYHPRSQQRNQSYSGMENDYNTTDYGSQQEYPSQWNANRSDYIHQSEGQNSYYGQSPYDQNSTQSWSQPVRNDEVPQQFGRTHYGKGPKGFKRSDDRIREEVSEALFHDHAVDASEIEVAVNDGEVTLKGTVSERRMKRLAEDCVEKVAGVKDVRNEIRIQASPFADRSEKTGSLPNTDDSSSDRFSPEDKSKSKTSN